MTPGARRVLDELANDGDIDLVEECNVAFCGNRQTTTRVVRELLSIMAISITSGNGLREDLTRYGISSIGQAMRRRPALEQEIQQAVYGNKGPFSIIDDRIKYI